jgi:proteasome assembly chaperone (PAC2) family protein
MDAIHRFRKPSLRRPRALIAFEGWNDACDAASAAATFALGHYGVEEPFAVIEPDEFFDFQAHRPKVSIGAGGTRQLSWPTTKFYAVPVPDDTRDLVIVIGEEPSYRWKTFSRNITRLLSEVGVEEAVLLGAFIGDVAHTLPVPIIGVATDPGRVYDLGLMTSTYEGPTGIVGVLQEACREEGMPAMSLWAATPHYLAANPNPKAALALTKMAARVLRIPLDTTELETVSAEFDERIAEALAESDELADYVAGLEDDTEDDEPDDVDEFDPELSDDLVTEIEDYLRDQG